MWLSSILLGAVAIIVGVLAILHPQSAGDADPWRAVVPIVSLGLIGGGAYALQRLHGRVDTVVGLMVVCAAAFAYALSVEPLLTPGQKSDSIVLSLPVVAATVSGVGRRSQTTRHDVRWCSTSLRWAPSSRSRC